MNKPLSSPGSSGFFNAGNNPYCNTSRLSMPMLSRIRVPIIHPVQMFHVGPMAQVHAFEACIKALLRETGLGIDALFPRIEAGVDLLLKLLHLVPDQLDFAKNMGFDGRQFAMHHDGAAQYVAQGRGMGFGLHRGNARGREAPGVIEGIEPDRHMHHHSFFHRSRKIGKYQQ